MDKHRQDANEQLMDELAARVDDVARIPAERLDELGSGISPSNSHDETPIGRRKGRESW